MLKLRYKQGVTDFSVVERRFLVDTTLLFTTTAGEVCSLVKAIGKP